MLGMTMPWPTRTCSCASRLPLRTTPPRPPRGIVRPTFGCESPGRAQANSPVQRRTRYHAAPPPPPPPKDFRQPAGFGVAIPHGLPGPLAATGSFWQVVGDGTATARDLLGPVAGQGLYRGEVVGQRPEGPAWVIAGPRSSNEAGPEQGQGELEAAGVHPLRRLVRHLGAGHARPLHRTAGVPASNFSSTPCPPARE